MSFLPKDYTRPVESNYMKFEKGTNKFRILDSAIVGYEWWEDVDSGRKSFRTRTFKEAVKKGTEPIKHFWAFPVWNYQANKVQILEVTQKTIMKGIEVYTQDEDWGDPKDYDITVNREGDGMDTDYTVKVSPKSEIGKELVSEYKEMSIQLEALYAGADPFKITEEESEDLAEDAVQALN